LEQSGSVRFGPDSRRVRRHILWNIYAGRNAPCFARSSLLSFFAVNDLNGRGDTHRRHNRLRRKQRKQRGKCVFHDRPCHRF
jgi:hypothetical protein